MSTKQMTCICCPVGCFINVEYTPFGTVKSIKGNSCKRGLNYVKQEIEDPQRMVSGTARIEGGESELISLKTEKPVPRYKVRQIAREMSALRLKAPVKIGETVIENVARTDVNIIATMTVNEN